jgi:hypothetical protein
MDFVKSFVYSANTESDTSDGETLQDWSSSDDEDESKITKSKKSKYLDFQFSFINWDDLISLLQKDGNEPRKQGLPTLEQLVQFLQIEDDRLRNKALVYANVAFSDFKYYLPHKERIVCKQDETKYLEKSLKIKEDLQNFNPHFNGVKVNCREQSYILTIMEQGNDKLLYKLEFLYDIEKRQNDSPFSHTNSLYGLCDNNELTKLALDYLSIDSDSLFDEQLGNGCTLHGHQHAILQLLPKLINLGEPKNVELGLVPNWIENYEPFMLRPNEYENTKHTLKSRKNKLKQIDKWIHKQLIVVPRSHYGYLVNVIQEKIKFKNTKPNYMVHFKHLAKEKEIFAWPHVTKFSTLLIEWLVKLGYPRSMYKAIAKCLAMIGT